MWSDNTVCLIHRLFCGVGRNAGQQNEKCLYYNWCYLFHCIAAPIAAEISAALPLMHDLLKILRKNSRSWMGFLFIFPFPYSFATALHSPSRAQTCSHSVHSLFLLWSSLRDNIFWLLSDRPDENLGSRIQKTGANSFICFCTSQSEISAASFWADPHTAASFRMSSTSHGSRGSFM